MELSHVGRTSRPNCGTPVSTWCAANRDHAYANGLSIPLRLQQSFAMAAKKVQGCAQAFHLRGAERPYVDINRPISPPRPVSAFVASQEMSNDAHGQRRAGNAHKLPVPPGLLRVRWQLRLVDEPEGF